MAEKISAADFLQERQAAFSKLMQAKNLPELSDLDRKALTLLLADNVNKKTLVRIITHNHPLTKRALDLINTGNYGLKDTVKTINSAIEQLGLPSFKQAVYAALIMDFYSVEEADEWEHVYSSSLLMTKLTEDNPGIKGARLIFAMLVHDLGKIVLKEYSYKSYQAVLITARERGISQHKAEMQILKIGHADAGGVLLKKWNISQDIIKTVFFHHHPAMPKEYAMETALVQFVNWVDCQSRSIICAPPCHELLKAANFEEFDINYMVGYQRNLINSLDSDHFRRINTPLSEPSGEVRASSFQNPLDTDTRSRLIDTASKIFKKPPDSQQALPKIRKKTKLPGAHSLIFGDDRKS